jgi:hypothetical protein
MRGSRGTAPLDCGQAVLTRRRTISFTALAAAILAAACSSGPAETAGPLRAGDIKALRWLAPDADRVKILTARPASCLSEKELLEIEVIRDDPPLYYSKLQVGQLAFESPALLGGAAARMGLSCSSCHMNGRGNPDFFLDGVSDRPGTADVTSSFLSRVRGDHTFNPVAIPDVALRDGKQIKDRRSAEFRAKVYGLIVEEFDGQEPPAVILDAVIAYLDHLSVDCPDDSRSSLVSALTDLDSAVLAFEIAARESIEHGLLARISRERLERVHERFVAPDQAPVRLALLEASRAIAAWNEDPSNGAQIPTVRARLATARALVLRHQDRSLYNPEVLRAALAAE